MVIATKNRTGVYLSKDEHMDEFLSKGYDLYIEENGVSELLATPKDGFIRERPTLVQTETIKMKG